MLEGSFSTESRDCPRRATERASAPTVLNINLDIYVSCDSDTSRYLSRRCEPRRERNRAGLDLDRQLFAPGTMVLTWQELPSCLPAALQSFLSAKYGIVPVCC